MGMSIIGWMIAARDEFPFFPVDDWKHRIALQSGMDSCEQYPVGLRKKQPVDLATTDDEACVGITTGFQGLFAGSSHHGSFGIERRLSTEHDVASLIERLG